MTGDSLLGKRGEGYVVIQLLLFGLILFGPQRLLSERWPQPFARFAFAVGIGCLLYAAPVVVLGILNLGRNLAVRPHPREDASLVQHGVFRIVRHPIYSGLSFSAIGFALLIGAELTLLWGVLLLLFFDIKSRREERMLAAKFAAYDAYQQRVSKLIPLIY